ncbi:hypothetical protein E3P99_02970 [Wallemia hederae]|uniref:Late embryogenesis abundant protein LEA-2 subgroup domain-containing protein n=1 Tax=Wallemia hederae TaxID=1540922 RepID=A0A4T0FHE2_9BASI|nr:hypothetical protein E3P99_02970 [Wallemia hederae]
MSFARSSDILMGDHPRYSGNDGGYDDELDDPRNLFRKATKGTKQSESVYSMQTGRSNSQSQSQSHSHHLNNTEEEYKDYDYRVSHYAAGQSFDPAADFNNVGPRYIPFEPQPDSQPGTPHPKEDDSKEAMVTIPGMGPEWHADELKGISKTQRRKEANWDRKHAVKGWFRGQRKCFGISRKVAVFVAFGVLIALILLLYFLIPRAPSFTFRSTPLLTDDPDSASFLTFPSANFSYDGSVAISLDTTSSWIPIKVKHMEATVYDAETSNQVGSGGFTTSKSYSRDNDIHVNVPVHFAYEATDSSDPTWTNWHEACRHRWAGEGSPTTVSIRLKLDMQIEGLTSESTVSQSSNSDVACPFQLPADSP